MGTRPPYPGGRTLRSDPSHPTRVHVHGLEAVVLRYFNVFGLRQDLNSQYSVAIPLFIAMALEGCSPTINGDGEQTRDFTHVENVIEVNLMSADVAPDRVSGQVFNVGAGADLTKTRAATGYEVRVPLAEGHAEHGRGLGADILVT